MLREVLLWRHIQATSCIHVPVRSACEGLGHWSTAVAGLRAAAQGAVDQASGLRVGLVEAREELARLQRGREHAARHHRCHVRIISVLKSNQSPRVGLRGAVALLTLTPTQCCRTCHI